jgi:hypothetical protein
MKYRLFLSALIINALTAVLVASPAFAHHVTNKPQSSQQSNDNGGSVGKGNKGTTAGMNSTTGSKGSTNKGTTANPNKGVENEVETNEVENKAQKNEVENEVQKKGVETNDKDGNTN